MSTTCLTCRYAERAASVEPCRTCMSVTPVFSKWTAPDPKPQENPPHVVDAKVS